MFTTAVWLAFFFVRVSPKYIEGELKTSENWAFLTRFCFLSEEGQFEFHVEYNEDQGEPNLLLYYDSEDQWPAVYKTDKSCTEKEAVLKIEQNQIVNLTIRNQEYRELSGCGVFPSFFTTSRPPNSKSTISVPTLAYKRRVMVSKTTEPPKASDDFWSNNSTSSSLPDFIATAESSAAEVENVTFSETQENISYVTKASREKRALLTKSPRSDIYVRRGRTIVCHNARRFRSSRERWWFVAVSNCNGHKGIDIKFRVLMTNGPPGDYWHEQFSADEFYILPVLMAFSIAYSFLILAIVVCSIELKSRQLLHSTYKLFVFSVFVQFFGILLISMAFLKYAVNGVGSPNVQMFGEMFTGCSETCFLLLLLLLAKGYTVTRGRLSLSAGIKLTVFMCLYAIMYISLFIYKTKVFDPGEVLYLYESPAGYGLIVLRLCAWCMFIYSTVFTLKRYPEKANFYYPFNICGTLWFIAGPAFILSANSYIDKWVRESIVCAVLLFITFSGHLMFLLLTMPSVANKNFPYHVRTSQIGVMELTGSSGNNTIEQFGHHVYEPAGDAEQTVIIPLTRRTEEIFGAIYSHQGVPVARHNGRSETADDALENVLSWSLAKNLSVLDVGECADWSRQSHGLDIREANHCTMGLSRRSSTLTLGCHRPLSPPPPPSEMKEVPLELFTVSRMVNMKNKPKEEET